MNRYKVIIRLTSGNEVHANVVASNQDEAIKRIQEQKEFKDFAEKNDIKSIDIKQIDFKPISPDRFIMQKSERPGYLVCTDKVNKIVVRFKEGRFNETREITPLEDFKAMHTLDLAEIMREIGEWIESRHT